MSREERKRIALEVVAALRDMRVRVSSVVPGHYIGAVEIELDPEVFELVNYGLDEADVAAVRNREPYGRYGVHLRDFDATIRAKDTRR